MSMSKSGRPLSASPYKNVGRARRCSSDILSFKRAVLRRRMGESGGVLGEADAAVLPGAVCAPTGTLIKPNTNAQPDQSLSPLARRTTAQAPERGKTRFKNSGTSEGIKASFTVAAL
jgi:hypothetical protein